MSVHLPDYEQVIFDESPLEEVICQLRFNPILKIATTPPAEFQEAVRKSFPVVTQEQGVQVALVDGVPLLATPRESAWQFKTPDEQWTTSLTSTFIALKTATYQDFDHFLDRLVSVVGSFEKVYEPSFYVRVGLRYVNRFFLPREKGQPVRWQQVLNEHIASVYGDPVLGDGIAEAKHHLVLQMSRGQLGWRYSKDSGQSEGRPTERFTLDFDHFVAGQIPCDDIVDLLRGFNDTVYRLFRWCLTDAGYQSLRPRKKPDKGG
ncbi:MAG: TIGR04255 family protein [Pseudomonadota bacterium]